MGRLPAGTVTILFSEIQGSTLLLARLGERYVEALATHRTLLSAAWARWRGHEVRVEGDSFFVVFEGAHDAVSAAIDAQRSLAVHPWPDGESVRVRMGLHTGRPLLHENDYEGMDVHRAARIVGVAHGGQVLVSAVTGELVASHVPTDIGLIDLGWHRLKDLTSPERLFQVAADGLESSFPPPKSLGAVSRLPVPATPLVGRDGELREMNALLSVPGVRLATLTGPGGSGKTRLAIALASGLVDSFEDGVYFVPLASLTEGEAMWAAIADVVGVGTDSRDPVALLDGLRDHRALLVLDNLEQVADASRIVAAILADARRVVVLATSRRPLHLAGEHEHPVPPLQVPERLNLEEAQRSGAVQLFVQQARSGRSSFALTPDNVGDVSAICRRVDGLPLAIELAASRIKLLSPSALLARLDETTGLRAQDVDRPTRQQTLRAAISWSYDLLTPEMQRAFRLLGVVVSGCDLDALGALIGSDQGYLGVVAELVDVSLATIADADDGEPRVSLLQTVSDFALAALGECGELDEAHRRHAQHFAKVAEEQADRLWSGSSQLAAHDRLAGERGNITTALVWALHAGTDEAADLALRLAGSLWYFWGETDQVAEGRRWLDAALDQPGEHDLAVRARALSAAGTLAWGQRDYATATRRHSEALELQRQTGDVEAAAYSLNNLAAQALDQRDYRAADQLLQEARQLGTRSRANVYVLCNLGELARGLGDYSQGLEYLKDCIELCTELGDVWMLTHATVNCGLISLAADDLAEAARSLEAGLEQVTERRAPMLVAILLEALALLASATDQPEPAARLFAAASALQATVGQTLCDHDAAFYSSYVEKVRAALGEPKFDELTKDGAALTSEQALSLGQEVLERCRNATDEGGTQPSKV